MFLSELPQKPLESAAQFTYVQLTEEYLESIARNQILTCIQYTEMLKGTDPECKTLYMSHEIGFSNLFVLPKP